MIAELLTLLSGAESGLARKTEKIAERSYKAVAQVNCELIGYDNNSIDVSCRLLLLCCR